ncbi:MAG: helix-turn-helix domain-containing protein [Candidatus Acetothermia bacterium]|jgi:DNA-binding XRE family transcriptional regulator|nr:helix-turn-helix domain-containing protein [Candidatus Acetothermia bacterium]MDH7505854.1 helix-turn-helix transcriptional regulator [Candidatus Acetothermia bacterium]
MAITDLKSIVLPEATRMMTRVDVDEEHRWLRVWFADGLSAVVPAEEIERAGRPVSLDLSQVKLLDPYVILIANTEGGIEEVPWDLIRRYCDAEFSRSEQRRDELSRRALGARLRRLRERAGLTQDELAAKAEVGRATISRIENGKMYAHTATLRRLAKALNLDLVDLITETGIV